MSVLISDFDNKTGDAVFDGTLEPMLGIALEGAPFISSFNRGQAKKIATRLQPGLTQMDGKTAQLVAVREGVNVVVTGSIVQDGGQYKVSVAAIDPATGKILNKAEREASSKQDVLAAAGKLAESIRKGLGDTTPESVQKAAAETFSAGSLEAAHDYAVAQDLQQAGKWDDALKSYAKAVQTDPNLGRGYAGMAVMYSNLGKTEEATKYYRLALERIDRMTDREKYRTRSGYYLATRNQAKAIEELSALVNQYPADTAGHANLALAYFYSRDMNKALEEQKRALAITPHSILQRSNFSMYALYAGDFETAAKEAKAVLAENPNFEEALRTSAIAALGLGHNDEAAANYQKLQAVDTRGASIANAGLADLALYEGRVADASALLEKGVAADTGAKDTDSAANKTVTLGLTQVTLGKMAEAMADASKAIAGNKDSGVIYRAAQIYIAAGQRRRSAARSRAAFTAPRNRAANLRQADCRRSATQARQRARRADFLSGSAKTGRHLAGPLRHGPGVSCVGGLSRSFVGI